MCDGWIHLKCTVISPLKFHTLCSSTEPYLCQNCYSELFPFQTLDDKQLLNEMRNDDKLNFDINHTNNSFFPAKCLQADNKIKSLLNDLNSGLVDSKYCSQAEANIINKKCKFSLLCVNIRSLNASFDKLNELLTNYDVLPDIIAISIGGQYRGTKVPRYFLGTGTVGTFVVPVPVPRYFPIFWRYRYFSFVLFLVEI